MSHGESGEKAGDSAGDDSDRGDRSSVEGEGEGDSRQEGAGQVDDAVLNDLRQTLNTSGEDSGSEDVTDASKSGGDSAEDPSDVGGKQGDSESSSEKDSGDDGSEQYLADMQATFRDWGYDGVAEDEKGSNVTDQGKDDEKEAQDSASGSGDKGRDDDAVNGGTEAKQQFETGDDEKGGSDSTQKAGDDPHVDDARSGDGEVVKGQEGVESYDDGGEGFPIRLREFPDCFVGDNVRALLMRV